MDGLKRWSFRLFFSCLQPRTFFQGIEQNVNECEDIWWHSLFPESIPQTCNFPPLVLMRVILFGSILSFGPSPAWALCRILASTSRGALRRISLQKAKITSKHFPRTWWHVQSRGTAACRRKMHTFSFTAFEP